MGDKKAVDEMIRDGLSDAFSCQQAMSIAENIAEKFL